MVPKLRNFLYMHVVLKKAQNVILCTKSMQIEWVFSLNSYKYAYFYYQWLKLICFSIIVLQKVSATNFAPKKLQKEKVKKQRNT